MPDFIPAIVIIIVVVIDLTIADGVITMILEMVRYRRDTRGCLIGATQVGQEAITGWPQPAHQAGPGGPAYRNVAVGPVESGTFLRQPVNVW